MAEKQLPCIALAAVALTSAALSSALVAQSAFPVRLDGQTYTVEAFVAIPPGNGEMVEPEIASVSGGDVGDHCVKTPISKDELLNRCRDDDGCLLRMVARTEGDCAGVADEVFPFLPATLVFGTSAGWESFATRLGAPYRSAAGEVDDATAQAVLAYEVYDEWSCTLKDDVLFEGPVFSTVTFALIACADCQTLGSLNVSCTLRIDD